MRLGNHTRVVKSDRRPFPKKVPERPTTAYVHTYICVYVPTLHTYISTCARTKMHTRTYHTHIHGGEGRGTTEQMW